MKKIFLMSAAIGLYGVASASDAGVQCCDMDGFNFGFEIGASVANSQIDTEDSIGASQCLNVLTAKQHTQMTTTGQTEANQQLEWTQGANDLREKIDGYNDAEAAKTYAASAAGDGEYPLRKLYRASHTEYSKQSQNSVKGNIGVNVTYGLNENTAVGLHLGLAAGAKTRSNAQRAGDLSDTGYTTETSELGGVSFEALLTLQQKVNDMFVLAGAGINMAEVKSQIDMHMDKFDNPVTISTKNKKPAAKIMLGIKKPITPNSSMVYKLAYTFGKKKTSTLDTQRVSSPGTMWYAVNGADNQIVEPTAANPADHSLNIENAFNCIIDRSQHKMKTKGAFDFTVAYEVNLH